MKHFASPSFWNCYNKLPNSVRILADKNIELLKNNPSHSSLRLKKVDSYWSVRVGLNYRSLAVKTEKGLLWFWIGNHKQYEKMIER